MTDTTLTDTAKLSATEQLWIFFAKVLIGSITLAAVLLVAAQITIWSVSSMLEEQMPILKGGPIFWRSVEVSLNTFADRPDMDAAKKARIIESLRKLSKKYRPFIDALNGSEAK